MTYIAQESRVLYKSKDGTNSKEFDVADFIASLASHIPNKGEQIVRYFGYCSNVCRGKRKKDKINDIEFIIQDAKYKKGCNKSWAHLIKKIYEAGPLICPRCGGDMRIIASVEDFRVIKKILDYLGIYEFRRDSFLFFLNMKDFCL